MRLLLAVLQATAGVGFQHAVLGAEVAVAEAAVADDPLGGFLALLEAATGLARCHGCWDLWFIKRDAGCLMWMARVAGILV